MQCESVICSSSSKKLQSQRKQFKTRQFNFTEFFTWVCVRVCMYVWLAYIHRFISISFSILNNFFLLLRPYVKLAIFAFSFQTFFNFHYKYPISILYYCLFTWQYLWLCTAICESSSIYFPVFFNWLNWSCFPFAFFFSIYFLYLFPFRSRLVPDSPNDAHRWCKCDSKCHRKCGDRSY